MLSHKINSPWRCTFSILLFVILFNYFKSYDCKNDTTISLPSLTDYDLHTFNRFKNVSMVKHSTTTSIKPISNDKMLKLKALVAIFSISMISFMIVRCIRHLKNDGYYKSSRRLAEGGGDNHRITIHATHEGGNGNRNGPSVRRDVIPGPNGGGPSQRPPPYNGPSDGPNGGRGPLAHDDQCMVSLTGVDHRHPLMEQRPEVFANQQQQNDGARGGDGRDQGRSRDRRDDRRDDRRRDERGDRRHDRRRERRDDRHGDRRRDERGDRRHDPRGYFDPSYYPPYGGNMHLPPAANVVVYPPTSNYTYYPTRESYNPYSSSHHYHHQYRSSNRNPYVEPSPTSSYSSLYSSDSYLDSRDEPYNSRQSGFSIPRNPYQEHPLDNRDRSDRHHHSPPHQHSRGHHHSHHPSDPQPNQESDRFPTPPPPHSEYEIHLADLNDAESGLRQLVASLSPTPPPNQLLGENDPLDSTQQSGDEDADSTAAWPEVQKVSDLFFGDLEEEEGLLQEPLVPLDPHASDDTNGAIEEGEEGEEDKGSQPNGARKVGVHLDENQRSVILEEKVISHRLRQTRGHIINQQQSGSSEEIIEQESEDEHCGGGCCGCIRLVDRRESQDTGIPMSELQKLLKNFDFEDEDGDRTEGQENTALQKNEEETNIDATDPQGKAKIESYGSDDRLAFCESSDVYDGQELLIKRQRRRSFMIKTLIAVAVATILFFILISAVVSLELRERSLSRPNIPAQNAFVKDFELFNTRKEQLNQIIRHFDFERNNTKSFMHTIDSLIKRHGGENWGWDEYNYFVQQQAKMQLEFDKRKAAMWRTLQTKLDAKDAEYESMQRQLLTRLEKRIVDLDKKCQEEISQAHKDHKKWLNEQNDRHQQEYEINYKNSIQKIDDDLKEKIMEELQRQQQQLQQQLIGEEMDLQDPLFREYMESGSGEEDLNNYHQFMIKLKNMRRNNERGNATSVVTASPNFTTLHPTIQKLKQDAEVLKEKELKKLQAEMNKRAEEFNKEIKKQENDLGKRIMQLQNKLHEDEGLARRMAHTSMKWVSERVATFKQQQLEEYRKFIKNELEIRDAMEKQALQEIESRQT